MNSIYKIECGSEKAVEAVESACGTENCVVEGLAVLTDSNMTSLDVEWLLGFGYVAKTTEPNEFDIEAWGRMR